MAFRFAPTAPFANPNGVVGPVAEQIATSFPNSSLLPWIMYANSLQTEAMDKDLEDTQVEAFLEHIQPCSIGDTLANCSEVCQNNTYLFDPLNLANIVACGS